MIRYPSNGTTAAGYLAAPATGSGPGVIVIQEWWGLADHAFFNDTRHEVFHAAYAKQCWERMLQFFSLHLH